jgi:two-component system, NarL family, sensor kinase
MKHLFTWMLLLASPYLSMAQKERIRFIVDSTTNVARSAAMDTIQCDRYCNLSAYTRQLDAQQAVEWAQKAVNLSHQLTFNKGLKCAYNNLGIAYYSLGNYRSAIAAFASYKDICVRISDSDDLAWGYNNIGNVYIEMARFDTTLLYYDSAYKVRVLMNDSDAIAQSHSNYGYIYKELGNYTYALVNLYKAVRILEPLRNENALAYAYDFIGSVYGLRKQYAYSISFYRKALPLYVKLNNRSGQAIALHSIGTSYYELQQKELGKQYLHQAYAIYLDMNDVRQLALISSTLSNINLSEGNIDSAEFFAQASLQYHQQNDNKRLLASAYLTLAKVQSAQHKTAAALANATLARTMSAETGERNTRKDALLLLSEMNAASGNTAQAYAYRLQYDALKDSILNENTEKTIAEMETKYETAQKDFEISRQASELGKKGLQLIVVVMVSIAILLLLALSYNRYRLKQKIALNRERLEQQELRNKAIIEAEEKERIRIARELHDGIGQQLSAAKMNLSAFESSIEENKKDNYRQLMELVDDAVKEVRNISHNMMPNALLRSGLSSAVREFVNKLSSTNTLKIDLHIVGLNERLDGSIETVLYRVIQECVSNIIKHAQASHIHIQLIKHDRHLNLLIEDNGKGFDTQQIDSFEGIGLKNIVSRVMYLNHCYH